MFIELSEPEVTGGPLIPMGKRRQAAHAAGREWVKIIVERTARGRFGPNSGVKRPGMRRRVSTLGAGYYGTATRYNYEYAMRKGYGRSPVTLGGRNGRLLGSMRHGVKFTRDGFVLGIMFDTPEARRIANWTQVEGAGRTKIVRQFVYTTVAERRRIYAAMMRALV